MPEQLIFFVDGFNVTAEANLAAVVELDVLSASAETNNGYSAFVVVTV